MFSSFRKAVSQISRGQASTQGAESDATSPRQGVASQSTKGYCPTHTGVNSRWLRRLVFVGCLAVCSLGDEPRTLVVTIKSYDEWEIDYGRESHVTVGGEEPPQERKKNDAINKQRTICRVNFANDQSRTKVFSVDNNIKVEIVKVLVPIDLNPNWETENKPLIKGVYGTGSAAEDPQYRPYTNGSPYVVREYKVNFDGQCESDILTFIYKIKLRENGNQKETYLHLKIFKEVEENKVNSDWYDFAMKDQNRECFDCGAEYPEWFSEYFGCFLCDECSGRHRELGNSTRGTFLDSPSLDTIRWRIAMGGNSVAAELYTAGKTDQKQVLESFQVPGRDHEKGLKFSITPEAQVFKEKRLNWIKEKYQCNGPGKLFKLYIYSGSNKSDRKMPTNVDEIEEHEVNFLKYVKSTEVKKNYLSDPVTACNSCKDFIRRYKIVLRGQYNGEESTSESAPLPDHVGRFGPPPNAQATSSEDEKTDSTMAPSPNSSLGDEELLDKWKQTGHFYKLVDETGWLSLDDAIEYQKNKQPRRRLNTSELINSKRGVPRYARRPRRRLIEYLADQIARSVEDTS